MVHALADLTLNGSAQQLTATATKCNWVILQGVGSNAVVRVGDSNVATGRGGIITATGGILTLPPVTDNNGYDLSLIYVIGTNNDKITILYFVR